MILQDYLRSGGTERQTIFLAEYFRRSEHEVSLITFRPGGRLSREWPKNCREGIWSKSLQIFDCGLSFYAPSLMKVIESQLPDVILCMGRMANLYAGWIKKRFSKIRVIAGLRTGKSLSFLSRWSLSRADGILVNSQWWFRQLVQMGFDSQNIKVIHNSMALPLNPGEIIQETGKIQDGLEALATQSTCVFLNVASFRSGKRQNDLIRIFSRLDRSLDWQLWFVGEGSKLSHCQRLAKRLGMRDRVHFFGYCPDPGKFYQRADVAVSTSQEDSLPNFLIEAEWFGLPVMAMKYRGVEETFRNGSTGLLIPEGDEEAFLAGLHKMISEPERRKQFGLKASEHARKCFSPGHQAAKILQFLSEGV